MYHSLPINIHWVENYGTIKICWLETYAGYKYSLGVNSVSNGPGQAGLAKAWPGPAYGVAKEAWPVGRRPV